MAIWWEQGYFHRLVIWDSVECIRRYLNARGHRRFLRPDSGGAYQVGQEVYPFLLEVDRDRGHRDRLVSKFRKYYDSRRYPGPLETGPMPRLLIVCCAEGRARQVNEVLVELAQELEEPVLDAAITTVERVRFPGRFGYDGRVERIESDGPSQDAEHVARSARVADGGGGFRPADLVFPRAGAGREVSGAPSDGSAGVGRGGPARDAHAPGPAGAAAARARRAAVEEGGVDGRRA